MKRLITSLLFVLLSVSIVSAKVVQLPDIASIATARLADNDTVIISGDRGGTFRYETDASGIVANGGTIFEGPGGIGFVIRQNIKGVYDLRWWDTSTSDDTSVIQTAIDLIGESGTLYVPNSDYQIKNPLVINDALTIRGDGWKFGGVTFEDGSRFVWTGVADHSGTAQAGDTNTITLAADASALDDAYNGFFIRITGGPGDGQLFRIIDYNGTSKVAIVHKAWNEPTTPPGDEGTIPDNTSTYSVQGRILQVGDGAQGVGNPEQLHNIILEGICFDGQDNTAGRGIVLGLPNDMGQKDGISSGDFEKSVFATLKNVCVTRCATVGIESNFIIYTKYQDVQVNNQDGDGFWFKSDGGDNAATQLTAEQSRAIRCKKGWVIEQMTTSTIDTCYGELNDEEAFWVECTHPDSRLYVVFKNCSGERNQQGGAAGTGVAQVVCTASSAVSPLTDGNRPKVIWTTPRFRDTATNDFEFDIGGMNIDVEFPEGEEGSRVSRNSSQETRVRIVTKYDPLGTDQPWTFNTASSGTVRGNLVHFSNDSTQAVKQFFSTASTGPWKLATDSRLGQLRLANGNADGATSITGRITVPHYDGGSEQDVFMVDASGLNGNNRLRFGGGTSLFNSVTEMKFYAAPNDTTVTGTEQFRLEHEQLSWFDVGHVYNSKSQAADTASINVSGARFIDTSANTVNTTHTITSGVDGQLITIETTDAFSNVVDGTSIKLDGGTTWQSGTNGGTLTLKRKGSTWYEISRATF